MSSKNNATEAPLGFAGDVDGSMSFRLAAASAAPHGGSSSPSSSSLQPPANRSFDGTSLSSSLSAVPVVKVERLPPPSLQDEGLVGGGVTLAGMDAGRSVLTWRAQQSGLWLEERGLDDDLEGGGLHLKLQGGVSTPGAVGIFGSGGDRRGGVNQSAVAVCAFTDEGVVHRVLLRRPAASPGEKASSALSAMMSPQGRSVVRLKCNEAGQGPSCWITRNLLVVGGEDGSLHCVRIVDAVDGQAAFLSEETLRARSGWNPLSGRSGDGAKIVCLTGFWQEEEKQATVLTFHTDWSFRVWTTTRMGARRGGALVHKMDARPLLGPSHRNQTAAVDSSGCFLSKVAGQEGYVVAAVAAEGGLPIHMALFLPPSGGDPEQRGIFEAPSDAGPLLDAYVDDNLTIWTLWDRPPGGGGGGGGGGRAGLQRGGGIGRVCSYGGVSLDAVHHHTIDEWLCAQEEEDGVFDDLHRTEGGWSGLVSLRSPLDGRSGAEGGGREVAFAAVELMESFYLRRMFRAGRFGRRALSSAIREVLPRLSDARPLSSNSTSLQDLQDLALEGVRNAAEQAFKTLDGEDHDDALDMSETWQHALRDVHALWRRLLEACVTWGRAEARPLGLAPGGTEEFSKPFVVRGGRTACLMPHGGGDGAAAAIALSAQLSPAAAATAAATGRGDVGRVSRLRDLSAGVPAAFEEALMSGAGGAAAAMFRKFDLKSSLQREGTAGGLTDADNLPGGLEEEGGYKRAQETFLRDVAEILLRSAAGVHLADAAAAVLQTDAVRDVLAWAQSLVPAREMAPSRALGHRGGIRGGSCGIATAAAFGAVKIFRERSAEARNTAVVLMLVLEQIDRVGLPEQLEANIVGNALPLALKCINQHALAAEVGSHHIRIRSKSTSMGSSSLGRGGGRNSSGGGLSAAGAAAGGRVSAQPATVAALKPWGCTALEGLFLDGSGVVQDYWVTVAESNERRRLLALGGLPALLAGMCEGTLRGSLKGLDSGGLVGFLHASEQYQLALPLVGLAVEWQWRMKVEPETAVLTAIARGFLYSAEAAASSGGGGGSSTAGALLDRAIDWYLKASQSLRASLLRRGGGGDRGDGSGGSEMVVKHFEEALEEVERVRGRVRRGGPGANQGMRMASPLEGEEGEGFGGRGAVNALKLARAALSTEMERRSPQVPGVSGGLRVGVSQEEQAALQRKPRLCRLVFKHASEALSFREAFEAICGNPIDLERKGNLRALAQHMCETGRLGELCLLPLEECPPSAASPTKEDWLPSGVVEGALWGLARGSNVADLVGGPAAGTGVGVGAGAGAGAGAGRKRGRGRRVNYYDCLYALFMAWGEAVEAARAQDELRERLETHQEASTLPFKVACQRARLAALNALAVAAPLADSKKDNDGRSSSLSLPRVSSSWDAPAAGVDASARGDSGGVASICPPVGERRLDSTGRPAGVRTAAVLGREAVATAAAIGVAVTAASAAPAAAAAAAAPAAPAEDGREETKGRFGAGHPGTGVVAKAAVVLGAEVSGVVEALTSAGRFEEAADVVLTGLSHQPSRMVKEMNKVVDAVARSCVSAEDIAKGYAPGPLPPLVRGVGPLKPRVPMEEVATMSTLRADGAERAASLWPILRQLLRLDSPDSGFSYHKAATKVLLEGMPASTLPPWLEDSYLGRGQEFPDPPAIANAFPPPEPRALLAPWKAFTPGDGARRSDPAALLDMYVFDGRLKEACLFLSRLLDAGQIEDIGAVTQLMPEMSGGTDFLPYDSIDRLFSLCENHLERSAAAAAAAAKKTALGGKGTTSASADLEHAFAVAEKRLVEYFKITKAASDQAHANRAKAARKAASASASSVTTPRFGESFNTMTFMLTD